MLVLTSPLDVQNGFSVYPPSQKGVQHLYRGFLLDEDMRIIPSCIKLPKMVDCSPGIFPGYQDLIISAPLSNVGDERRVRQLGMSCRAQSWDQADTVKHVLRGSGYGHNRLQSLLWIAVRYVKAL